MKNELNALLGLTLEQAVCRLERDTPWRVTRRDSRSNVIIHNVVLHRVNFHVDNNVVTNAYYG